jgi:hypothetical protein
MSHYVGFPIERTAFRLMACRHIGRFLVKCPRLAATAAVRLGMRDQEAQYALPNGPISYR